MSDFPDFSSHGYQVEQELGHNRVGGRVTYLAMKTKTQLPVVIKQFQFAQRGANWSEYEAYEREVQLLRQLNHPSIPWYLDSFETPTGFCLVQEYIPAPSLAEQRYFTPEEIKQIAVAILEVLVYLQQQVPLVIHRDIKPENILVNTHNLPDSSQQIKVYLVDFGFGRLGGGEIAVSSVIKGTLGFMPPEQLFNRQLTEASDLYGLGATLICLLTKTKSTEIGNLIDETYRLNFKQQVSKLNPQFLDWLEKMVAPNLQHRYPNAATALKALQPIDTVGNPTPSRILLPAKKLKFVASMVGLATFSLLGPSLIIPWTFKPVASVNYKTFNSEDPIRQLLMTRHCMGCNLRGVNLRRANLWGTYLAGADLRRANLKRVNLVDADLRRANLRSANLGRANLGDAYLGGANLKQANLGGAYLGGAYLGGADLRGANLRGANLRGADLEGADLRGVNLKETYLEDAYLEGANLEGAIMPDGLIYNGER